MHIRPVARGFQRFWALIASTGITRQRMVALEVTGRTSGKVISLPLMLIRVDGERYLASMLGDAVAWSGTSGRRGDGR